MSGRYASAHLTTEFEIVSWKDVVSSSTIVQCPMTAAKFQEQCVRDRQVGKGAVDDGGMGGSSKYHCNREEDRKWRTAIGGNHATKFTIDKELNKFRKLQCNTL